MKDMNRLSGKMPRYKNGDGRKMWRTMDELATIVYLVNRMS